ncbi:hypothetical protein JZ751_021779 [Albula glossodonta]|uniref:Ig-like domain-containing protein n=1 Tax=Albula glossodonta TaxID=121402 RepID=A0A8T2NVC2_9TELE|nr:hypothetical protein JZ751_021779 [Albula glossodonta]
MSCTSMLLLLSGQLCLFYMGCLAADPRSPGISLDPNISVVTLGQNITITCNTLSLNGSVYVELNGERIAPDQQVVGEPIKFQFIVNSSHEGNYSCVLNATGSLFKSGVVIVKVDGEEKPVSHLVPIAAGSAGGAVVLLLSILGICVACKGKTRDDTVVLRTFQCQNVEPGEYLESEPDYMDTPSLCSGASYINVEVPGSGVVGSNGRPPSEESNASYVNVEIPVEEESEDDEGDYVNADTLATSGGDDDDDSESDYENSAYLKETGH